MSSQRTKLSPLHGLFLLVPLSLWLDHTKTGSPAVLFFITALSIVPLAGSIGKSTEKIAQRIGPIAGGLLNATFGNLPELIILIALLRAGSFEIAKAALFGAVVGNLLFAMGLAFFLGGLTHPVQRFNSRTTKLSSSMMMLAVMALMIPSVFQLALPAAPLFSKQQLGLGVAVVLIICYLLSLVFLLGTHRNILTAGTEGQKDEPHSENVVSAIIILLVSSAIAAVLSEILCSSAETASAAVGMSKIFVGAVILALVGAAAEIGSALMFAKQDKMDLAVGVLLGSSTQIVLFVAPILVFASLLISSKPFDLSLGPIGAIVLFFSVLIGSMVVDDGESSWFKGVQLITTYSLIALMLFFVET